MITHPGTLTSSTPFRHALTLGLAGALVLALGLCLAWQAAENAHLPAGLQAALHASWAVRTGGNPYDALDRSLFHGPPLAALSLVPLAQPPFGEVRSEVVPAPLALLIWYLFSITLLAMSVHGLAQLLQGDAAVGSGPWWRVRLLPVMVLAGPLYLLLAHSHAEAVLVAMLTCYLILVLRQRTGQAGLLLGSAMACFLLPGVLLVVHALRRDRWMTFTTVAGLGLCLMLAPGSILGLQRTSLLNQQFFTDARSLLLQPLDAWLAGALVVMTLLTCTAARWRLNDSTRPLLHVLAALLCIMTLAWPTGEGQRYVLLLPAIMIFSTMPLHRVVQMLAVTLFTLSLALPVWFPKTDACAQATTAVLWGMHTLWLAKVRCGAVVVGDEVQEEEQAVKLPQAA